MYVGPTGGYAIATGPISKVRNWGEFITFGISYFIFRVSYFRSFLLSRQDPYEYEYGYSGSTSDREFAIGIGIRQVAASGRLRGCGIRIRQVAASNVS